MTREALVIIVGAAQNGDSDALNTLFQEYYNDVYYFALKTVKDGDLAYDITQETFLEIFNTIGQLQEPAAFVSWMKRITYHQCTRYFKKKKDVLVDETEDGASIFDTIEETNEEFIPAEALDKDDFRKTILAMIDQLSEEQRAAVMMYYFDEMSIKQIADVQGVSEGTVKSRLNYARKAIKASVEEYEEKHGIKLHAIPFLPFIGWLFAGDKIAVAMPQSTAQAMLSTLSCAGTNVAAASAAVSTAAGST
ncbi:MAG: RNA polymerase sigma factor, partial [Clostridia bacterium]|nr:RNA polymerase sigma factor [Clostridia bacterium]